MQATSQTHVLIIGAGITGLLVAQGLKQAGVSFDIFDTEDRDQWRFREWSMSIHWGLPLLNELLPPDLAACLIQEASVDPTIDYERRPDSGSFILDGFTGEVLKELSVPEGEANVRVSRRKLRTLCQEGLEILWGHMLDDTVYTDGRDEVTASFTNGKKYTGSLIVGCDGPHSRVREFLFTPDIEQSQTHAMEGITSLSATIQYSDAGLVDQIRSVYPVWLRK